MTQRRAAVAAIVLNWNKSAETLACLRSLEAQSWPDLSILVVDNGSSGAQLAELRAGLGRAGLIRHDRNLGFTGGVNAGLARASGQGADYIWLVNSDLTAPPNTLARLLDVTEADPSIGLASPIIRNADAAGAVDYRGGLWLSEQHQFITTDDQDTYRRWESEMPGRIWLPGTALLVRAEAYRRIGEFDTRFFAYWEDNDYAVRNIRAGFRNVVVQDADVLHHSGHEPPSAASKAPHYFYYMARNEILFWRKHAPGMAGLRAILWAFERQFRQAKRLDGHAAHQGALYRGLWDGLCGRGGAFQPEGRISAPGSAALWCARRILARQI